MKVVDGRGGRALSEPRRNPDFFGWPLSDIERERTFDAPNLRAAIMLRASINSASAGLTQASAVCW